MKSIDLPIDTITKKYLSGIGSLRLSREYRCSKKTILDHLKRNKIKIRHYRISKINISNTELKKLYISKKMSTWKIEKIYGYSRSTLYRRISKLGINRDMATAHIKYDRNSFSGKLKEKAYLEGFTIGDLRVRKVGSSSKTIKVDCASTKIAQVRLFSKLFSKYGRVWISSANTLGKIQMEAFLDDSFSFLLNTKNEYNWAIKNEEYFLSFLAGFIDAEGSFYIGRRPAFSIGNYDYKLLGVIQNRIKKLGFKYVYLYHDKRKNKIGVSGYPFRQNYYTLAIHRKYELLKFINLIKSKIKHEDRSKQITIMEQWFNRRS